MGGGLLWLPVNPLVQNNPSCEKSEGRSEAAIVLACNSVPCATVALTPASSANPLATVALCADAPALPAELCAAASASVFACSASPFNCNATSALPAAEPVTPPSSP